MFSFEHFGEEFVFWRYLAFLVISLNFEEVLGEAGTKILTLFGKVRIFTDFYQEILSFLSKVVDATAPEYFVGSTTSTRI